MPKYFDTANYCSFIRQLNAYGFVKNKEEKQFEEFYHPDFKKGGYRGLSKLKKKAVKNNESAKSLKDSLEELTYKCNELEEKLNKSEVALNFFNSQNNRLLEFKQTLEKRLEGNRKRLESKMNKIIFSFYFVAQIDDAELLSKIKGILEDSQCGGLNHKIDVHNIKAGIESFIISIMKDNYFSESLLDKIFNNVLSVVNQYYNGISPPLSKSLFHENYQKDFVLDHDEFLFKQNSLSKYFSNDVGGENQQPQNMLEMLKNEIIPEISDVNSIKMNQSQNSSNNGFIASIAESENSSLFEKENGSIWF